MTSYKDMQEMLAQRREKFQALRDKLQAESEAPSPDVTNLLELRRAVQMFVSTMDVETQAADMLSIATVFPKYEVGKAYKIKDVFSYGKNAVGDPQLYQVLSAHTSAAEWSPDTTPSLYKAIGVTEDGYPEWVQPLGATDAYSAGDMVSYNGKVYRSLMDANVYAPDAYPDGWEAVE